MAGKDEFDWGRFERTEAVCTPPEWLADDDGEEEPAAGMSWLQALAAEPGSHIEELQPGRFYVSKLDPGDLG